MNSTPNDELLQKAIETIEAPFNAVKDRPWAVMFSVDKNALEHILHAAKRTLAAEQRVKELEKEHDLWDKSSLTGLIEENNNLRSQLAMANDAAAKGEAGRQLGTAYEECRKENKELSESCCGLLMEREQLRADVDRLKADATKGNHES